MRPLAAAIVAAAIACLAAAAPPAPAARTQSPALSAEHWVTPPTSPPPSLDASFESSADQARDQRSDHSDDDEYDIETVHPRRSVSPGGDDNDQDEDEYDVETERPLTAAEAAVLTRHVSPPFAPIAGFAASASSPEVIFPIWVKSESGSWRLRSFLDRAAGTPRSSSGGASALSPVSERRRANNSPRYARRVVPGEDLAGSHASRAASEDLANSQLSRGTDDELIFETDEDLARKEQQKSQQRQRQTQARAVSFSVAHEVDAGRVEQSSSV